MSQQAYMAHAIQLARQGWYTTRANPRVGCVIVKNDQIVGEGFHEYPGGPHAEINALYHAGESASGADCYVTLEPCSHHGKTPPCTDALIKAGISHVVVAMTDPNPSVSGSGMAALRDAGITVTENILPREAETLNPGFIKRMTQDLPYVRVKMAMSLDGRTAMASGESQWITGEAARADVHRLRAQSDAILTGSGTVLADNPCLTFRVEDYPELKQEVPADTPQPLRVVCDSRLQVPTDARLLSKPGQTLILTLTSSVSEAAFSQSDVEVLVLPEQDGKVSLQAAMQALAQREVNEVLVEAGPGMAGALLSEGLVDELVVYMAPHLMGDQARGMASIPGLVDMANRMPLEIADIRAVGADWRITARPTRASK